MDYLSDEWLAAVGSAAAAVAVADCTGDDAPLVIQTVITDGPDHEVAYHLVIDGPTLAVHPGRAPAATVTFTQSHRTASEIASGRRSAQAAFMAGEVQVGGNVTALIEHREALRAFDDVMASVASATEYPKLAV